MNLDELNSLFASAWSSEEKAQMFEGIVRGSNGTIAPESSPKAMKDANALGLKWRSEAEEFLRLSEEAGKKSAAVRASKFGTSQPPSGNHRTPFDESSNQATSHKLQAGNEQHLSSPVAPLPGEQQSENDESGSRTKIKSAYEEMAESAYTVYPRKVGRDAAIKAIAKAIKSHGVYKILEATREFSNATSSWPESEKQYIPHPATWFNQARFLDDRKEWWKKSTKPNPNAPVKKFFRSEVEDHSGRS